MPFNPTGRASDGLPDALLKACFHVEKRAEPVIHYVLGLFLIHTPLYQVVPIDIFSRIAQFRAGRDLYILSFVLQQCSGQ